MKARTMLLLMCAVVFAADTNQPPPRPALEIKADFGRFDLRQNTVFYSNDVLVVDPPAKPGDAPTTIRCRELTATRGAAGKLETIVAVGHVQIDQSNKLARAGHAVYYATNETMVLTEPFDEQYPWPFLVASGITNFGTNIVYHRLEDRLSIQGIRTFIPPSALKSAGADSFLKPRTPKTEPAPNP